MSYSSSNSAALRRTSASRSLGLPPNFFAAFSLHANRTSAVTARDESSAHRNSTLAPTMISATPSPHAPPPAQYNTLSGSSSSRFEPATFSFPLSSSSPDSSSAPLLSPAETCTSTSSNSPDSMRVRTSASMSVGAARRPGRHRSCARRSSGDAPGSGRSTGRPRMDTALGTTPGGRGPAGPASFASSSPRDPAPVPRLLASAAAIAAPARSAQSSRTTASGRWWERSARTSRAASAASTCETPTR